MSWTRSSVAFAVAVGTVVVAACGGSHASTPTPIGPPGSAANPAVLTCQNEASSAPEAKPGPNDLVLGPLSFPDGLRLPSLTPKEFGSAGHAYKIPPVLAPGSTVTITIAASARTYVRIDNPYFHMDSPSMPRGTAIAATYRACAHRWGFFPQSFVFTDGRSRGCVPMDIRVGSRPARRVTLELFTRRCA